MVIFHSYVKLPGGYLNWARWKDGVMDVSGVRLRETPGQFMAVVGDDDSSPRINPKQPASGNLLQVEII